MQYVRDQKSAKRVVSDAQVRVLEDRMHCWRRGWPVAFLIRRQKSTQTQQHPEIQEIQEVDWEEETLQTYM